MVHDRKIWVCSFLFKAYGFMQYSSLLLWWKCHLGLANWLNVELRMLLLQFTVSLRLNYEETWIYFYNISVSINPSNVHQYLSLTKYDLLHIKCHQKNRRYVELLPGAGIAATRNVHMVAYDGTTYGLLPCKSTNEEAIDASMESGLPSEIR